MNKNVVWRILLGCMLVVGVVSCSDDDEPAVPVVPDASLKGVFILNEGSMGKNTASLSFYDTEADSVYLNITEKPLGDTAQDMLTYGGKLYISVSGSNRIVVIDLKTKKEIKVIDVKVDGEASMPRYLTSHNGKVYASIYSGHVTRIDTTSLSIEKAISVGNNPEGVAVSGNKLYVAISNGLASPDVDNKVAVVDLTDFATVEQIIEVNKNPYFLRAEGSYLYVSSQDVYNSSFEKVSDGKFQRINLSNNGVEDLLPTAIQKYLIADGLCYYFDFSKVWVLNLTTDEAPWEFITDGTNIGTPYGIGQDPVSKEIYVSGTDYQNPGKVHVFNKAGKVQRVIDAEINPNGFAFYY